MTNKKHPAPREGGNGADNINVCTVDYNTTPTNKLLPRLEKVKRSGRGEWVARCPAHDDGRPSLAVKEADDGKLLIHCFAECAAADVLAAVGLTLADLFPDDPYRHDKPARPFQRRISPATSLRAISHEATLLSVIASDMAQTGRIDDATRQRLLKAASRVNDAMEVAHV